MSVATPTHAAGAPATAAAERTLRRVAWVLLGIAVTLFVASSLHLSGAVHGSPPYDADHAGIAEALIGVVLATCAIVMLRARARGAGLAGTAFAVVGFGVGLNFTSQGGHAPDIAYHVTLLPVLLVALIVLLRTRAVRSPSADAQPRTA
jgi:hypothetical protein